MQAALRKKEEAVSDFCREFKAGAVTVTVVRAHALNTRPSKFDPARLFYSAADRPLPMVEVKATTHSSSSSNSSNCNSGDATATTARSAIAAASSEPEWNQELRVAVARASETDDQPSMLQAFLKEVAGDDGDGDEKNDKGSSGQGQGRAAEPVALTLKVWDTNHTPKTFLGQVALTFKQMFDAAHGQPRIVDLR